MQVNGVDNMSFGADPLGKAAAKAQDAMGKDAFLKLLVTQLQNQDPLNPADNTEFVAQLAQFSSLEGITNLNTSMADVASSVSAMQDISSASLVGRYARTEGDLFELAQGSSAEFGYTLDGPAASVKVAIADSRGRVVRVLDMGAQDGSDHAVSWDGNDQNGTRLDPGTYGFKVTAVDPANRTVLASPYTAGVISSISFKDGRAALKVDGREVSRDSIQEIY
ncbi:MAG: flagellar hook assembly protein FlgD [Thermodesulfobacteriota bacterium]